MSYKNYKWGELSSDFNSPFFRNYIWVNNYYNFPKKFKLSRPIMGIYAEGNQMKYVGDISTWKKTHEEFKSKIDIDNELFEKLIDTTNRLGESMNKWTLSKLFKARLGKFSNKRLSSLFKEFAKKQELMYSHGVLLPLLDFQGFSFIESNLEKYLKANVSEDKYADYYQVFTEPPKNSFAQDQEVGLLKLLAKFYTKQWSDEVSQLSLSDVKNRYSVFYKSLERHAKKYAWVYYVYAGPAFTCEQFFEFVQNYLKKGINPSDGLKELKESRANNQRLKKKYLKELKPNRFERLILNLAGKVVWAKPRRKDYQSRSYFHSEKLMKEIGERLSLSVKEVRAMPFEMIYECLERGERPNKSVIDSIESAHACLPNDDGTITILVGDDAKRFYSSFTQDKVSDGKGEVREIKGSSACRGFARGIVRIINVPDDMVKMNNGDILVSMATTPSVVPAMKKAGAIVTDEGGLTCHAAIVSRELRVPCVIGTKIATKVLKDGDLVEVDADRGIVKILGKV